MKKNDIHQTPETDCADDAFEVKNAMLVTALLAEANNPKAANSDSGVPKSKSFDQ
jgi:hypothetical protein